MQKALVNVIQHSSSSSSSYSFIRGCHTQPIKLISIQLILENISKIFVVLRQWLWDFSIVYISVSVHSATVATAFGSETDWIHAAAHPAWMSWLITDWKCFCLRTLNTCCNASKSVTLLFVIRGRILCNCYRNVWKISRLIKSVKNIVENHFFALPKVVWHRYTWGHRVYKFKVWSFLGMWYTKSI